MVDWHGFEKAQWERAKAEARNAMIDRAKVRGRIPYSELVTHIKEIELTAHDPRLFHLLGEISTQEANEGRGMLTAIVVHKFGDMQPGPGFFELARSLGLDTKDITACWIGEFNKVHDYWANKNSRA
jgi:hypothetical protein